ncbi:MAG TPA: hypothetical protein VMW67_05675 [Desulfobacteria bacterium]|nr:hypothetical protein [Desulfobacteria bacterium]
MIYTECKPDSSLVRILGIPKKQIIHHQGKPEVCKQLEKRESWIGLVDEDPFSVQPSYLKRLPVKEDLPTCGLKILNDTSKNNELIILSPRLEEWILKAAKDAGINIKRYNLPNDEEKLHEEINTDLRKFERLVNDLRGKSEMIKALEKALLQREDKYQ